MAKRRVLVVEDDIPTGDMVRLALEVEGYDVAWARDGEQALELIQQDQPDLVLVDLLMPVMDGWHFVERLRDGRAQTRVVVMSAFGRPERLSAEVSADAYLAKPFDLTTLYDIVREQLASPGDADGSTEI
jgi:DNA-binding response OmpR family regulator